MTPTELCGHRLDNITHGSFLGAQILQVTRCYLEYLKCLVGMNSFIHTWEGLIHGLNPAGDFQLLMMDRTCQYLKVLISMSDPSMWCRKPCLPIANLSSRISQRQIHARPAQTFIAQRQRLESRTSEERLQLGWNFFKIKARTIRMRALKVKKALIEKNNQSLWDGHFRFSVMFHGLGDLSYSMAASY